MDFVRTDTGEKRNESVFIFYTPTFVLFSNEKSPWFTQTTEFVKFLPLKS
jgi:hypothetical protein